MLSVRFSRTLDCVDQALETWYYSVHGPGGLRATTRLRFSEFAQNSEYFAISITELAQKF